MNYFTKGANELIELKIDPKLQKLFKPLPTKDLEDLKGKLLKKYDGTPLYVWKGNIIVDGHNRYPILKENNIEFKVENVEDFLGEDCTKSDVMQWMVSHQQARRNMTPGELIYANSMVADEIALENKEKVSKAVSESNKTRYSNSVQMDANEIKTRDRSTNTREQVAKMSGVGTGTVARYDAIMKSDDEELKEKVRTGEVKIGTAYTEVRNKNTKVCKVCGKRKKNNEFYVDDDTCMDCRRKEADEHINDIKFTSKPSEEIRRMCENAMSAKDAKDIDPDTEIRWLKEICNDFILRINNKFFDMIGAIEKFDTPHIQEAYDVFEDFVSSVFDIQEKFNSKKENCDE